jgi:hypothetical protein
LSKVIAENENYLDAKENAAAVGHPGWRAMRTANDSKIVRGSIIHVLDLQKDEKAGTISRPLKNGFGS